MEIMSIGKFANKVGLNAATLRRMDESGELKPYYVSQGGTRYYSEDQLKYFGKKENEAHLTIGYCRIHQNKDKKQLEEQIDYLKKYMITKGYQFEIIQDIGSGIDFTNQGLKNLLKKIMNDEVKKIVLLNKEILLKLGYEMIEYLCEIKHIEIEIIDQSNESEETLINDLNEIIYDFCTLKLKKKPNEIKKILKNQI